MGYVPSALGEPRGAIYWCDNRCSEKAIRYWQIASVVIEVGGEVRTINLCKLCYNEKCVQQGKEPRQLWEWKGVVEKKAHRRRLWLVFGSEQFLHGVWEYFTLKWAGARKIWWTLLRKNKKESKVSGNMELPIKKVLEQVK